MSEEILYGAPREPSVVECLRAGPVDVKFADGQLRYLRVGRREIVRRVYFAVRDAAWDTIMPVFDRLDVSRRDDGFDIEMRGTCRRDAVRLVFQGRITGAADGTITYGFEGEALGDFESPRIGICVLYGGESLAGRPFRITAADGAATDGAFPDLVSSKQIANAFRGLEYTTDDGVTVSGRLAEGLFDMEDQRNYGDSSYKAFTDHAFNCPNLRRGDRGGQSFELKVRGAGAPASSRGVDHRAPVPIAVDGASPVLAVRSRAVVPALLPAAQSNPAEEFTIPNRHRDRFADLETVPFSFTPAVHLWDDDTLMENVTAVVAQVRTLKSFAPRARVLIDAVELNRRHVPAEGDARGGGLFAATWCARLVKYLAIAGVDAAVVNVDGPLARAVLERLGPAAGLRLRPTDVGPHGPVDAFAIDGDRGTDLWVLNKTTCGQRVEIDAAPGGRPPRVRRLHAGSVDGVPAEDDGAVEPGDGGWVVSLAPLEVCILTSR